MFTLHKMALSIFADPVRVPGSAPGLTDDEKDAIAARGLVVIDGKLVCEFCGMDCGQCNDGANGMTLQEFRDSLAKGVRP